MRKVYRVCSSDGRFKSIYSECANEKTAKERVRELKRAGIRAYVEVICR